MYLFGQKQLVGGVSVYGLIRMPLKVWVFSGSYLLRPK